MSSNEKARRSGGPFDSRLNRALRDGTTYQRYCGAPLLCDVTGVCVLTDRLDSVGDRDADVGCEYAPVGLCV
jgi:hypothetical protein